MCYFDLYVCKLWKLDIIVTRGLLAYLAFGLLAYCFSGCFASYINKSCKYEKQNQTSLYWKY